jgi:hypothetical protein
MDNLFEDSDGSEGTESKTNPDVNEIPEGGVILGEHQLEDEEEEEEEKDAGYSPVIPAPDVDWDIIYENRPGRMVLDVVSFGPEPRTIQPGDTQSFDVVSSCPMGEQDTDGDYETFMDNVKATGLRILPVPILGWGQIAAYHFHLSASIHAGILQTTLLCNPVRSFLLWQPQV